MNVKIEILNTNALVITDTDSGKEIVDCPKRLVYYDIDELDNRANIRITNIDADMGDVVHKRFPTFPIGAGTTDAGATPFTIATWKTFARTNLGI
jgi:hypothetical protein